MNDTRAMLQVRGACRQSHTAFYASKWRMCIKTLQAVFLFLFSFLFFFMQEDLVKETKKVYIYDLPAMLSVVFLYIYHSIRKFIV